MFDLPAANLKPLYKATGSDDLIAKVVAELDVPSPSPSSNGVSTSGRREGAMSLTQGMQSHKIRSKPVS